jgi:hypothetical protein
MSGGKDRLKSAYERALERLEEQGIEPPRSEAVAEEITAEMAEARRRAEASLAELEILHRDKLRGLRDPAAREKAEEEYRSERRRIEEERDRTVERLREGRSRG